MSDQNKPAHDNNAEDGAERHGNDGLARFNVHTGRDAFRGTNVDQRGSVTGRRLLRDFVIAALDGMNVDELRRQQAAMRSFTQSIEMDAPFQDIVLSNGGSSVYHTTTPGNASYDTAADGGIASTSVFDASDYDRASRNYANDAENVDWNNHQTDSAASNYGDEWADYDSSYASNRRDSWNRNTFYDQDRDDYYRDRNDPLECQKDLGDEYNAADDFVGEGMRASSTVDTIIEVVKANAAVENISSSIKEAMGETQKYVMTVPGPGHVDQEIEMHASLLRQRPGANAAQNPRDGCDGVSYSSVTQPQPPLRYENDTPDEDEEFSLDAELQRVTALAEAAERAHNKTSGEALSISSTERFAAEQEARVRDAYARVVACRPRPTTPTQACTTDALERYVKESSKSAFAHAYGGSVDSARSAAAESIHISIPFAGAVTRARRRSTLSNVVDANVTPKWKTDTGIDLLETNPEYARNAPRKPVVHRRTSMDWENFEASARDAAENDVDEAAKNHDGGGDTLDAWAHAESERVEKLPDGSDECVFDAFVADEWTSKIAETKAEKMDGTFGGTGPEGPAGPAGSTDSVLADKFGRDMTTPPSSPVSAADATHRAGENSAANLAENVACRLFLAADNNEDYDRNGTTTSDTAENAGNETLDNVRNDGNDTADTVGIAPVRAAPPPPPNVRKASESASVELATAYAADVTSAYYPPEPSDPHALLEERSADTMRYDAVNPYSHTLNLCTQLGYDTTEQQPGYDTSNYYGDYGQSAAYSGYDYGADGAGYTNNSYATYSAASYDTNTNGYGVSTYENNPFNAYGKANPQQQYGIDQYGGSGAQYAGYGTTADYDTSGYDTSAYGTVPAIGNVYTDSNAYNQYGDSNTTATVGVGDYGTSETMGLWNDVAAYPQSQYSADYGGYDTVNADPTCETNSQKPYDNLTISSSIYEGGQPTNAETVQNETVPAVSSLLGPLLPPQRARTPDPFSWEVQESEYEKHGKAAAPPRPPRPASPTPQPSPARTPIPGLSSPVASDPSVVESSTPTIEAPSTTQPEASIKSSASPPPRPRPPPTRPPAPAAMRSTPQPNELKAEEEEDPWARFKAMSEQVSSVVKNTTQQLKNLSEASAANEIKDESYLAQIGGDQGFQLNEGQRKMLQMQEEKNRAKAEKKRQKMTGKRTQSPTFDLKREAEIERQAAELVKKMAATRADLQEWKPPTHDDEFATPTRIDTQANGPSFSEPFAAERIPKTAKPAARQEFKELEDGSTATQDASVTSFADFSSPAAQAAVTRDSADDLNERQKPVEPLEAPPRRNWTDFDADERATLPSSDSDFFERAAAAAGNCAALNNAASEEDPFAPTNIEDTFDPFEIRPAEEIIEEARKRVEAADAELVDANRGPILSGGLSVSRLSSPTPEGGSPVSSRPTGFDDDFRVQRGDYSHTPTPLYDEDDSQPLVDFFSTAAAAAADPAADGWNLMLRHPLKKKIMTERYWKPCHMRIRDNTVLIFNDAADTKPVQEIVLQASYSLSDSTLQAYDVYCKIHTVKLQHILYKERVGIRAGQISRLVEGHITKYGLPLEHAAQATVLAKFGSLDEETLAAFVHRVEDILFKCPAKRQNNPIYKQDEVQIHCYDEYRARVDRDGFVSDQRARVRFFCLAFLTGSPYVELGLNDRRREGKEIVRRKDILPMYTERWIRFEAVEFHNTVNRAVFDEDQVIRFQPPDGCFFEVMRFRVRPPKNREKLLTVKPLMKIAGSKVEITIKVMAAAHTQRARGTLESTRTIPCEDIQICFPIPESWIYIFREERHWGVGSVHSKTRRTGKVKNLRDRLMGTVQHTEPTLIEVAIGEAKYEHLFRALVWRIPRLPEKHHDAYKTHLLKCRFELSSFDLMPDSFWPICDVDFTMPMATISNTVVRSVAIEQHEDSDRVEKFVRYVAKCQYKHDIDYVHCTDLDEEIVNASKIPELETSPAEPAKHVPAFDPDAVKAQHTGYAMEQRPALADEWATEQNGAEPIELEGYGNDGEDAVSAANSMRGTINGTNAFGAAADSTSSDDEADEKSRRVPIIEINLQGYGY